MTSTFRRLVREALQNDNLQVALDRNAEKKKRTRHEVNASLPNVDQLRRLAKTIRQETISNLNQYLSQFTDAIINNGIVLHHARTSREARQITLELLMEKDAKLVVKSKSMVSEEIHLNRALMQAHMEVVETDLGEFIVQLRDEPPSHIVAPAIHLRREDVGETFNQKLGMPYSDDIEMMNATARNALRKKFLSADVGISGVNFGVAETGTICLVTNEGNGRMVTTLPRMHIALMGVERLVPTLKDLEVMLRLLPRFATGQKLTSYISLIHRPRGPVDPDGPDERHLILIDNGRRAMRESPLQEALLCIRCGSCLDFCPVYREIGGYSYESTYTGPIGSVVSPGLFGLEEHGHLAKASTLCGACKDACPVDIDLPTLLLRTRDAYAQEAPQPTTPRLGMRVYTWIMENPSRLRWGQRLAWLGTRLLPMRSEWGRWLPPPLSGWTRTRDFPPFVSTTFRQRFDQIEQTINDRKEEGEDSKSQATGQQQSQIEPVERFLQELESLKVETIRCESDELAEGVLSVLRKLDIQKMLSWALVNEDGTGHPLAQSLRESGIELVEAVVDTTGSSTRKDQYESLGDIEAGLTGAIAGFADTGTLVLPSGEGQSQLASLLPSTHLAVLPAKNIFPSMHAWLEAREKGVIHGSQSVSLITGPSRTADIEMTLSIGVHGPGKVIVFIVD